MVSIGPAKAEDQLRAALAMGADRAILVLSEDDLQPLASLWCSPNWLSRKAWGW